MMKLYTLVTLVALTLAAPARPAAAAESPGRPATLAVTGEASVTRAPDRATVTFRIETIDDVAANATSRNSAVENELTRRLGVLGIQPAAISTASYGISYNPRPPKPDPAQSQRFGYTVERTIAVTLDGADRTGPVVDAGVAAGVTNVDGIAFSLRDPRAALRAAQTAALADGVLQAKGLANAAGVHIVRILAINPGTSGPSPIRPMAAMARMSAVAQVPTTIDPGDLTVHATVTLIYQIAP